MFPRHRTLASRLLALSLSAVLATTALVVTQVATAPAASAAAQNGYVFNDPWTLTGASASTQYSTLAPANNSATTQLPTTVGPVTVNAQFTANGSRNPGASFLTNGSNQGAYGASAAMFVGNPTPANVPALGLLTNGSQGCGGALNTAAHQNFNGMCNVGSLTLTFSRPMTDMVLDISGLGGSAFQRVNTDGRGSFNSTVWDITSPGVTFSSPQAAGTNLMTTATTMRVTNRNTSAFCNQATASGETGAFQAPQADFAGCGSVILQGTYTSVTFAITSMATPYSAFPTAQFGTGSAFFRNTAPYADGINGLNMTPSEAAILQGNPVGSSNSDLQRISLRLPQLGSIGDTVWRDANGDGIQNNGESGAAGVTVTLTDANGTPITDANGNPVTTTTDANGHYAFTGLPFGDYRVRFSNLPAGFDFTAQNAGADDAADSDADPATGLSDAVHIDSQAPSNQTIDAGIVQLGSIGDTVWRDDDSDGVQDAGEPGVAGVTVVLYDAAGNEVARTTTDADGHYLFSGLMFGDYSVGFENLPANSLFTPQGAGGDAALDSDADPATGRTGTVTITATQPDRTDIDAGIQPLGTIGDTVWLDQNRDGVQDGAEPGVEGATVILRDADGVELARTTTDAAGHYTFTGLPMGDYSIEVTDLPEGSTFTTQGAGGDTATDSDVDVATGQTSTITLTPDSPVRDDIDAGVLAPLGSIGDTVWSDDDRDGVQDAGESGVEGVTVVLYDATGTEVARTTTDADGHYTFTDLPMGDYTVGFEGLPTGTTLTQQGAGDDTSADSDADPTTGRTGTVSLTPSAPDVTDVDAGILPPLGSIGDTVWRDSDGDGIQDAGEPGVAGVTVVLYDADGTEVARTTTDADGHYSFTDLPMGDYSVGFEDLPEGVVLSPQGAGDDAAVDSDADPATGRTGTVSLTPGAKDVTDVDAGLTPLGSIGDLVWRDLNADGVQDAGEPGVQGVTVVLYDADGVEVARTTTDGNGEYLFSDLPVGDYQVEFSGLPEGTRLTSQGVGDPGTDSDADPTTGRTGTVSIVDGALDVLTVDAGIVQLGSIGDTVWLDQNRDGIQDPNEPGVPAVTVVLYNAAGDEVARTVTDGNGEYLFTGLELGDYTVAFENLPTAATITEQGAGDDPATDSDADPATGRTGTVSLTNEVPDRRDVDAGVLPPLGSIGDKVWNDLNGDGIQDAGEPGVAGVTVVLYNADGVEVARTTTDDEGDYSFENLPMGDYSVGFEDLPADLRFTGAGAGDDGSVDSDADPATGRTATITLTPEAKDVTDVDAGVVQLGSVGDTVWRDLDDDGVQDAGEPGVEGVTVVLYDADGTEVARTTTDADGHYLFDGLELGDYSVGFEGLPVGLAFTAQGAGDDTAVDSDADSATGRTSSVSLTNDAPHRTDLDAGLVQLGSIGDTVWRDSDGDGIQDAGEPGVAGVTVVLYDADGTEVARTTTDADGHYSFTDLPMGDYSVGFEDLPEGVGFSPTGAGDDGAVDSDADPTTGRTGTVSLTNEAPNRTDVDAGLQPLGSIGDTVWRDVDGDGIQDAGEPGVAGVTVVLYDSDGTEVARTTTDADGHYVFTNLPLGDYSVGFEDLPEGVGFSPTGAGDDPAIDSDADPTTGRTGTVSLTENTPNVTDVDAGLTPLGSIGDLVWRDLDADGVQDAGEPGVQGVTVVLYDADGVEVARTTTDANGEYLFSDLPVGDYQVEFSGLPDGTRLTSQGVGDPGTDSDADPTTGRTGTVSIVDGALDVWTVDAGIVQLGLIGDTVWRDSDGDGIQDSGEPGVEGVTVVLYDADGNEVARTTTDADGHYLFDGLELGDYSVGFENLPEGVGFSPTGAGDDGAVDSDADPTTGRTGTVWLTNDAPDRTDVDAGLQPVGSIGDTVWSDLDGDGIQDAGEPGVEGVTVVLYDADGTEVARTTTDADGHYSFTDLPMGDYSVGFEGLPEGVGFSPTGAGDDPAVDSDADPTTGRTGTVSLTENAPNVTDVDAGLQPLGSIGDTVWRDSDGDGIQDAGEPGVAGVTVVLYDATGAEVARTTTDADGHYSFTDLPLGDYSVGFEGLPEGVGFSPAGSGDDPAVDSDADPTTGRTGTVSLTNEVPDRTDVDAGLQPVGSIGDMVWRDLDGDGIQDPGEPGVEGVTVVLYDADGTEVARTTTDADGHYVFTDLPLGDYSVGFEDLPEGVGFSPTGAGDDPAVDSDADPITGRTGTVSLTESAPNVTDVDAGLQPLGSIGDTVWRDLDGDGIQDPGEPGVEGVTVVLYNSDGTEVARTTTDADGQYSFTDLPLGDYSVGFEDLPEGVAFTSQGIGSDPATDSDADPSTGRTGTVSLTNDAPDVTDVDAGLQPLGSIGDTVWRDLDGDGIQDAGDPGVEGVTVVLYDSDGTEVARTTTDANGHYVFTDLPMGDYSVGFEGLPEGVGFSPTGAGDDPAVDSDADPTTGRTGTVSLTSDAPNRTDVDAGVQPLGSIGDTVWRDLDGDGIQDPGEPGVEGVTVVLYDSDGTEVARTTTDANGHYVFTDLPLGDYSVGFERLPEGVGFSPTGTGDDPAVDSDADPTTGRTGTVSLTNDAPNRTDVDTGLQPLGSIGDTVWLDQDRDGIQDPGEPGVEGVTVVLYDADGNEVARTTTDADGHYSFTDLPLGDYSIGFEGLPTGATFTGQGTGSDPATDSDADPSTGRTGTVSLTNDAPDVTDVDAGLLTPLGSIGSRVWDDRDGDGVQDPGEPGVPGVTVILYDVDGNEVARTTTDANGDYLFVDLPMGEYELEFTDIPDGYNFTIAGVGGPDTNSDVNPLTGRVQVSLTSATPEQLHIDAGLKKATTPSVPTPKPGTGNGTIGLPKTGGDGAFEALLALFAGLLLAAGGLMVSRRRAEVAAERGNGRSR